MHTWDRTSSLQCMHSIDPTTTAHCEPHNAWQHSLLLTADTSSSTNESVSHLKFHVILLQILPAVKSVAVLVYGGINWSREEKKRRTIKTIEAERKQLGWNSWRTTENTARDQMVCQMSLSEFSHQEDKYKFLLTPTGGTT